LRTLYLAPSEMIRIEALRAGAERVMIVGHNPGLQDLAVEMARGESPLDHMVRTKYPTCAAALFERREEAGDWRLLAFLTPKG
jgi:phosphohistidine phosphatase